MVKGYFRSFGAYETDSINSFMKRAKLSDIKSVDVIIEYLYFNDANDEEKKGKDRNSVWGNIETRVVYEAKPRGYTSLKLRFCKTYNQQYDAIECTEKKIKWLIEKLNLERENITIKNSDRKSITKTYYPMMLKAAKKYKQENNNQ